MKSKGGTAWGEANANAKLDEQDIRDIRRLYDNGTKQIDIAALFAVGKTEIGRICRREQWSHVEEVERG